MTCCSRRSLLAVAMWLSQISPSNYRHCPTPLASPSSFVPSNRASCLSNCSPHRWSSGSLRCSPPCCHWLAHPPSLRYHKIIVSYSWRIHALEVRIVQILLIILATTAASRTRARKASSRGARSGRCRCRGPGLWRRLSSTFSTLLARWCQDRHLHLGLFFHVVSN